MVSGLNDSGRRHGGRLATGRQGASEELLTADEAARLLGVGTTRLRRWVETGAVPATAGADQRRRFSRAQLLALRDGLTPQVARPGEIACWLEALLANRQPALRAELRQARELRGSWAAVADDVLPAARELSALEVQGAITADEARAALERLRATAAWLREEMLAAEPAPLAWVAAVDDVAPAELPLLELALAELGWRLHTGEAHVDEPHGPAARAIPGRPGALLLLAGRAASLERLAAEAQTAAATCRATGQILVFLGRGPWPTPLPHGDLAQELEALRAVLPSP